MDFIEVAETEPLDVYGRLDRLHKVLNLAFMRIISDGVVTRNEAYQTWSLLQQVYSEIQPNCSKEARAEWDEKFKTLHDDIEKIPESPVNFPVEIYDKLFNLQCELKRLQHAHHMFMRTSKRNFDSRVAGGAKR